MRSTGARSLRGPASADRPVALRTSGAFGGIILEVHDAWPVRPVAEVFVEGERGSATTVSGLAGVIGRIREGLSWDLALRRARFGRLDPTELRAA